MDGLVLSSVSLLLSLSLNIIFCVRKRASLWRDTDECQDPHDYNGESVSLSRVHYVHNLNHHEQQENPIYGNIRADRRGSMDVCHEAMAAMQRTRDCMNSSEPNLNYASLDLRVPNKHRKKPCHQQGLAQARNEWRDQPPAHLTSPVNCLPEVETEMETQLPSGDASAMVPHISSIYMNNQKR